MAPGHFCEIQYGREDQNEEGSDGLVIMPAKAVEGFLSYSLERVLFMLTVSQQPYVAGRHLNTWESTCLSVRTVIWHSSKWLSRSPGVLVQPACTLPARSAGTWAGQASVLLFCISKVILLSVDRVFMSKCLHWTCTNPVQNPLTWSSLPLEEFLRDSCSVVSCKLHMQWF